MTRLSRAAAKPKRRMAFGWPCHYCKQPMTGHCNLTIPTRDHVMPRAIKGGKGQCRNIVWACYACNSLKGDMHPNFWAVVMRDIPEWWRLAAMRGPRGVELVRAMQECGFNFDPKSNGQPHEPWWPVDAPARNAVCSWP
jgi:hypothetical protein